MIGLRVSFNYLTTFFKGEDHCFTALIIHSGMPGTGAALTRDAGSPVNNDSASFNGIDRAAIFHLNPAMAAGFRKKGTCCRATKTRPSSRL